MKIRVIKVCFFTVKIFLEFLFILCLVSSPRGETTPTEMTFHEFGSKNSKTIILIHPSIVMWDYFEYVIPPLKEDFHVIVPSLPGYDKEKPESDFTSIEQIAAGIEAWLLKNGLNTVDVIYGCSMGGSIVLRLIVNKKIKYKNAIIDGGITPYQIPWILTRFIAFKDWSLMLIGKVGGIKLLEKVFAIDEYSKEDLLYVADVFNFISSRKIWNSFDSCNNYEMPNPVPTYSGYLEYWFAEKEESERKKDLDYMRKNFPNTQYVKMKNIGHAGMATLRAKEFEQRIRKIIK